MRGVPTRLRIGLAFFVALAAQPSLSGMTVVSITGQGALGAVIQQVMIGLSIGFAMRLVLAAAELAGELVGLQMGLSFASFFDPTMNTQSSAAAKFYGQMALFVFIVLNGHLLVLMTVVQSFESFPVDQNFLHAAGHMNMLDLGGKIFASGLWMALPMVGMLIFANLAQGVISRVAPQINIYAIGFPISLTVGLIGLTVTLPMLDQPMVVLIHQAADLFLVK